MRPVRKGFLLLLGVIGWLVLFGAGWLGWESYYESGLQVTPDTGGPAVDEILNRSSPRNFSSSRFTDTSTILLITLDTTRADRLSAYGYVKETSPNLEELARSGVRFDRAYAPMATTAPSHATILSALYPLQHRVLKNGHKMRRNIATLPELLSEEGYTTAAFVSTNRHFGESNVAQGFRVYRDPSFREQVRQNRDGDTRNLHYRPADRTLGEATEWLRSRDEGSPEKLFLWVHFFDPHSPYVNRSKQLKALTTNSLSGENEWKNYLRSQQHLADLPSDDLTRKESYPVLRKHRLYDSEVRYMDRAIGELLRTVRSQRQSDPLTVVVGDHGEGLGNHDWWGHGKHLYNEQVRVPLFLRFPGGRYAGRTVDTVVETNDILPTVLRFAGVDTATTRLRQGPIEGEPLQRLLETKKNSFGYAVLQRRHYEPLGPGEYLTYRWMDFQQDVLGIRTGQRRDLNYELGQTYSLAGPRYKYIYGTREADEFYDHRKDFYEQSNRVGTRSDAAGRYGSSLKQVIEHLKKRSPRGLEEVRSEIQERLKGLGYVN